MNICHMSAGAIDQKKASDALEVALQVDVSCLM